ncbi:MAG: UMP kinase, partial [Ilumatobacter sp.]
MSETVSPRWKRIVFKPSGEALAGPSGRGLDGATLEATALEIIDLRQNLGVDVAVVVGGGNFWRGRTGAMSGMDDTQSDHIGMLGTVMNALALQDALERKGQPTRVQSAIEMPRIAEPYIRRRAVRHLEKGRVVIFA